MLMQVDSSAELSDLYKGCEVRSRKSEDGVTFFPSLADLHLLLRAFRSWMVVFYPFLYTLLFNHFLIAPGSLKDTFLSSERIESYSSARPSYY